MTWISIKILVFILKKMFGYDDKREKLKIGIKAPHFFTVCDRNLKNIDFIK